MEMYCLAADLLGFRQLMLNLQADAQNARVAEWVDLARRVAAENEVPKFQLVSDTVLMGADLDAEGLRRLVIAARGLVDGGFGKSLPIRGGISFGKIVWDREVTYGPGVVRAYELAEGQDWVGACVEVGLPHMSEAWDVGCVCSYPVPMKLGARRERPTIVWDVPSGPEIAELMSSRGLTRFGEPLAPSVSRKAEETALYGHYLASLRQRESTVDLRRYYGSPRPDRTTG